ncbi:angiogenic factor with G patch and FHA domains 1 isoform X2 [Pleurodeles waltl]|uniref:angiogenic factor with G patch and FHA domains 1 isoform X2 n=1 Tax=Pleurodeles waltl TaxID=8319 RepID=UPI0037096144
MGSPQPDLWVTECSPSPSPPSSPVSEYPDREQDRSRTHLSPLRPTSIEIPGASLKEQLEACRAQVQQLEKLLRQSQRKERITDTYNQDLRQQVEDLSREIHERKKREKAKTDVAVQTEDSTSWSRSDYYCYPHENYYQSYDVPVDDLPANHQNEGCIPVPANQLVTDTSVHAGISTVENGQNGQAHDAAFEQNTEEAEAPSSLAESLRATAEAAVSQTGFTYDENTGLYYDHSTGFYYDSENQLYYDANSGSYYYFDADSEQYLFHSRVDLPSSQMMEYQTNQEKKRTKKQLEPCGTVPHVAKDIKVEDQTSVTSLPYHYTPDQQMSSVKKDNNSSQKKRVKRGPSVVDKTEKPILSKKDSADQNTESTAAFASVDDSDDEEGNSDTEEGEITNSEVEEDCCEDGVNENSTDSDNSEVEETSQVWPPCIRVIVIRSPVLETATLFIITAVKKATIGSENDMDHAIQIPEAGVDQFHAEVYFDPELESYVLVDQGSENGTIINGNHILQPAIKCDPYVLEHGDEVKIGETVLSFHMHTGTETCFGCEPGQIRAHLRLDKKEQTLVTVSAIVTRAEKERLRRRELKQIRAKYGLQNCDYEDNQGLKNPNYKDRARKRRRAVGSEGTFQRDDAPASVHIEINDTNKGHKMLKKMGWKKGEGLGKRGSGIKDPIQLLIRKKKAGLGAEMPTSVEDMPAESKNKQNWEMARKRFSEFFPNIRLKDMPQGTSWVKDTSK